MAYLKLYIKTLGEFDIRLDDESIFEASSRSYKLHRLFQYFITFKNKKLLPESIIDNLWQDSESFDPKNMLRVQIYRLRQNFSSIFPEDIDCKDYLDLTFINGYYCLNIKEKTIVDTDVFEQLIENANSIKSLDVNGAIDKYKSALQIYEGSYLEGSPYELWLVPIRNYYSRLYLKTLLKLIEILEERERYEEIVSLCEKALNIETDDETINICLMESMLKLGNVKHAMSHYEYLISLQVSESRNKPSIAMKDIYNKIQSQYSVKGKLEIRNIDNFLDDGIMLGPTFCDSTYFKFSYNLRKRRRKESSLDLDDYICLITLNRATCQEEHKKHIKELKAILVESFRNGDLITLWNDDQILILLLDSNELGPEIIRSRILNELPSYMLHDIQIGFTKVVGEEHVIQM